MVGHGLVDQVTGDVDDVSAFVVDLQGRGGVNNRLRPRLAGP